MAEYGSASMPSSPTTSTSSCTAEERRMPDTTPTTPSDTTTEASEETDSDTKTESTAQATAGGVTETDLCGSAAYTATEGTTLKGGDMNSSSLPSPPCSPPAAAEAAGAAAASATQATENRVFDRHRVWRWCPELAPVLWANDEMPQRRRMPKDILSLLKRFVGETCPHERTRTRTDTGLDMWVRNEHCRDCGIRIRIIEQGPFFC
eukprot:TRINITY_DN56092_c0_g1_i1.p1 TRINITY_DN56092_c0_g1~~TRINITY_DN56092_c0_g1_i1.p1  ORF type:complete len:237 (+),score=52.78 TRINITY_DN56092_c0_g1_i1:95-712(+)